MVRRMPVLLHGRISRAGGWRRRRREGGKRFPPILHLQKGANEAGSSPQHATGWKAVLELHTWAFPAGERPAAFTNSSQKVENLREGSGPFYR